MEQLLSAPEVSLRRETSGAFFTPARPRSTCSSDVTTESSSMTFDDMEEHQQNSRRITLCKQVLWEATTKYSAAPLVDMTLLKNLACRNSGALGPLLSMLAAEHDSSSMVRCLDTLSFLLMDRANRRACHELGGLDVLLDVLHRSTEQHILLSGLEALCCLCKHDSKDKVALWQHKKKGVLLSMLNSRHGSAIVVEALRTCRTLCFAVCSGSSAKAAVLPGSCNSTACQDECGRHPCSGIPVQQRRSSSSGAAGAAKPAVHHDAHYNHHHQHGALKLLEPGLLTMVSGLLHPAADTAVLMKALKLLIAASTVAVNSARSGADGGNCGPIATETRATCCGCWRTPVFQLVPLLTHCADVEVVESALAVLVNLSEHAVFHWLLDASGCIPPLLHLLSHKRCGISQSASCVLSVLAEGGMPRVKLCQDTALLAMLRVLQTNHCVVVTIGVLYMLGRLASFRGAVVRSLKGWGAVPLLNRLLATTRDVDAADGCRQLLQLLGVQPPPPQLTAGPTAPPKANLPNTHSSINVFGGAGALTDLASGVIRGVESLPGSLMRTISAAATVAEVVSSVFPDSAATTAPNRAACHAPLVRSGPLGDSKECRSRSVLAAVVRPRQHNSFRLYTGGATAAVTCGLLGTMSAAAAAAY